MYFIQNKMNFKWRNMPREGYISNKMLQIICVFFFICCFALSLDQSEVSYKRPENHNGQKEAHSVLVGTICQERKWEAYHSDV